MATTTASATDTKQESKNFRLVGHDPSAAWGGGSIVEIKNGHAYVGAVGTSSYDGPEGFTAHDVTDPRNPRKVWEFNAPPGIHMHKVRLVGDNFLYVNAEKVHGSTGEARTGIYIFDISRPAEPRQVGFYDMPLGGPHRFGVDNARQLALLPAAAEGWNERVIWTVDISDPLKPEIISQWGLPWQKAEPGQEPPKLAEPEHVCQMHGPPVIRGNRMYGAFWGGGVAIIDCTNLAEMKLVGHVNWSPPFIGGSHTAWPLGDRPYLIVTDEARSRRKFWDSQFMWVVDIRDDTNPLPVASFFPEREKYFDRPGRFGAHNILEYMPSEGPWKDIVFLTYFNAGLRAVDVSDPLRPKELGYFVPDAQGRKGVQSNDIGTDGNGLLYLIDRWGGGMHILEYTG
jgi:hypothetical protein